MAVQNMPPEMKDVFSVEPPAELLAMCRQWGVIGMIFLDDAKKGNRSFRLGNEVFVNIRGTYWDRMIQPPLCCLSYYEAVTMRLLHEVGHVYYNHPGDPTIVFTDSGLQVKPGYNSFFNSFLGYEGEAWTFALTIRRDYPTVFAHLESIFKQWVKHYNFSSEIDWDVTAVEMYQRVHGTDLASVIFQIPQGIFTQYKSFIPTSYLPYHIQVIE